MCNYSSTKLELPVHRRVVMERFCVHLLGSKFHINIDNIPLAYVRESQLGASEIRWLNKLFLFKFMIHYQTRRSNKVVNALSRHPHDEEIKN